MNENQKAILQFAYQNGNQITTSQANDLLAGNYYCNGTHHVAETLTRMVNNGRLVRTKRGVYEIGKGFAKGQQQIESEQQIKLNL
jgi:hypothetical protein